MNLNRVENIVQMSWKVSKMFTVYRVHTRSVQANWRVHGSIPCLICQRAASRVWYFRSRVGFEMLETARFCSSRLRTWKEWKILYKCLWRCQKYLLYCVHTQSVQANWPVHGSIPCLICQRAASWVWYFRSRVGFEMLETARFCSSRLRTWKEWKILYKCLWRCQKYLLYCVHTQECTSKLTSSRIYTLSYLPEGRFLGLIFQVSSWIWDVGNCKILFI